MEEIILKAVNKDPIDRYNSAEEMRSAINNILSNRELLTKKKTFFSKLFKRKDSSKKI